MSARSRDCALVARCRDCRRWTITAVDQARDACYHTPCRYRRATVAVVCAPSACYVQDNTCSRHIANAAHIIVLSPLLLSCFFFFSCSFSFTVARLLILMDGSACSTTLLRAPRATNSHLHCKVNKHRYLFHGINAPDIGQEDVVVSTGMEITVISQRGRAWSVWPAWPAWRIKYRWGLRDPISPWRKISTHCRHITYLPVCSMLLAQRELEGYRGRAREQ